MIGYYVTTELTTGVKKFFVTMTLTIEQPEVGQDIYMYLSFQNRGYTWYIARCHV